VLEISVNGGAFQDILAAGGIFFGGGYTDTLSTCCSNPLSGRQAWSGNSGGFVETSVVLPPAAIGGTVRFRFRTGTDTGGAGAGWFIDNLALGGNDVALTGFSRLYFSGSGSGGATFTIPDGTADYGTIRRGGGSPCFEATADCYELSVSTPTSRPVLHWDSIFGEGTSAGVNGTHAVHLGDSFADVPRASLYYRFVETLLHESVTSGCSPTSYCPLSAVLREQMAVFLIISRYGTGPQPPCTTPLFDDVPCTSPYAEYINRISNLGITSGCGGGNYCPTSPVLREQMAVFLLTTLEGSGYTPPACTTPMFADVPCASVYSRWINEIARRGVTAGCGGGNFCPGLSVTREQMAVFLTTTFTLRLY
jgi:hypothetical protein